MTNSIASVKDEDLREIEKYIKEEVDFWNDIANGRPRFISPMSDYSTSLWSLLEVMELPQADNGTIGVWAEHLSKVHGIEVMEDADYRCHCTTCRELAREVADVIQNYIVRQAD